MLARPLQRTRRARRGNYSVMMGVLIGIVVGFGAMSVDVSLMTVANLQNQANADAAAHAALIGFNQNKSTAEAWTAAQFVVNRNKVAMGHADLDDIKFGEWTFDAVTPAFNETGDLNAVNSTKAFVSRENANAVHTLLGGMLGVPTFEVDSDAVAAQRQRAVMLVLDLSCSMMDGNESSTNAPVALLREATELFYSYIQARPQSGDMIGMSTFALSASKEPIGGHPWTTDCNSGDPNGCLPPWLPLTDMDDPNVDVRIGGICDTVAGGYVCDPTGQPKAEEDDIGYLTNPAPALFQAVEELVNNSSDRYYRAILFMTDGMPTCGANCEPEAIAAATLAGQNGIVIFGVTVSNGFGNNPAFVDAVVAAGAEGGFNQVASDASALPTMFGEVARRLPTVFTD